MRPPENMATPADRRVKLAWKSVMFNGYNESQIARTRMELMRTVLRLLIGSVAISASQGVCFPQKKDAERDQLKRQLEWRWSKEKASLAYCTKQHLADYDVERTREKEYYTPIKIRSKQDRKVVYSLERGHEAVVFAR